ncbi:MAG: DUF6090 family protein [Bacteroidota bacterium]
METFRKSVIDMIPVVLGILIALFINNWQEGLKNQRFLRSVFSSISQEIADNLEELDQIIPLQEAVIDSLEVHLNDDQLSAGEVIIAADGFKLPTIKNAAWRSFLNTKIELIDYELISILSEIEEAKAFMQIKTSKLMDFIFSAIDNNTAESKQILMMHILNVIDSEEQIQEMHHEFLSLDLDFGQ